MKQISIKEFAKKIGVTRQAVGQKIKRKGVYAYPELIIIEKDRNFPDRKILWIKDD